MAVAQADRGMLGRIGFFLCREGLVPEAEEIFAGLAESDPEKDGPAIGLALCWILAGETEEALAMLDSRLAAGSPLAAELLVYKVLALGMAGNISDARLVREEMERNGMDGAVKTADLLLCDLSHTRTLRQE